MPERHANARRDRTPRLGNVVLPKVLRAPAHYEQTARLEIARKAAPRPRFTANQHLARCAETEYGNGRQSDKLFGVIAMPRDAVAAVAVELYGTRRKTRVEMLLDSRLRLREFVRNGVAGKKSRDEARHDHGVVVHPHALLRPRQLAFEFLKELARFGGRKNIGVIGDAAGLVVHENPLRRSEQPDLLRHNTCNTDERGSVANKPGVQIRVVAVGKVRERYVSAACEDFRLRIAPYYPLEIVEVKASLGSHPLTAMREEAERVLRQVHEDDALWLLDREGKELSSEELSRMVTSVGNAGTRRLTLAIAGTYGAHDTLRERANFVWSLSRLTFLHEWARMIVLEQIYRAAKIARNEPYHH